MAAQKRLSRILQRTLPPDHRTRIEELRRLAGDLPFHTRYVAGEHREVWTELRTLGSECLFDPLAIDALAVALEMMSRAAENVQRIIGRLEQVGYQFHESVFSPYWRTSRLDDLLSARLAEFDEEIRGHPLGEVAPEIARFYESQTLGKEAQARAARERRTGIVHSHMPPTPLIGHDMNRVMRSAGAIPVSLWAWYLTVGGVNLVGTHPQLAPPGVECDPLFVTPFPYVVDRWRAWEEDELPAADEPPAFRVPISPSRAAKAGASVNAPLYTISLPNEGLDAIVENQPRGLYFVDYLRTAFEWGGFPGYADFPDKAPGMIASLRDGLNPL